MSTAKTMTFFPKLASVNKTSECESNALPKPDIHTYLDQHF